MRKNFNPFDTYIEGRNVNQPFYNSTRWQKTRAAYLQYVGGLCERCLSRGDITPAKIVHHVIELTPDNVNNPTIALSFSNLEALCRACHNEEHFLTANRVRYRFDENGDTIPPPNGKRTL